MLQNWIRQIKIKSYRLSDFVSLAWRKNRLCNIFIVVEKGLKILWICFTFYRNEKLLLVVWNSKWLLWRFHKSTVLINSFKNSACLYIISQLRSTCWENSCRKSRPSQFSHYVTCWYRLGSGANEFECQISRLLRYLLVYWIMLKYSKMPWNFLRLYLMDFIWSYIVDGILFELVCCSLCHHFYIVSEITMLRNHYFFVILRQKILQSYW